MHSNIIIQALVLARCSPSQVVCHTHNLNDVHGPSVEFLSGRLVCACLRALRQLQPTQNLSQPTSLYRYITDYILHTNRRHSSLVLVPSYSCFSDFLRPHRLNRACFVKRNDIVRKHLFPHPCWWRHRLVGRNRRVIVGSGTVRIRCSLDARRRPNLFWLFTLSIRGASRGGLRQLTRLGL